MPGRVGVVGHGRVRGVDLDRAAASVADVTDVVEGAVLVGVDAVVGVIGGGGDGELVIDGVDPGGRTGQTILGLLDAEAAVGRAQGDGDVTVVPGRVGVVGHGRVGGVDLDRAGAGRAYVTGVVEGLVFVVVCAVVGVICGGRDGELVVGRVGPVGGAGQTILGLLDTGGSVERAQGDGDVTCVPGRVGVVGDGRVGGVDVDRAGADVAGGTVGVKGAVLIDVGAVVGVV